MTTGNPSELSVSREGADLLLLFLLLLLLPLLFPFLFCRVVGGKTKPMVEWGKGHRDRVCCTCRSKEVCAECRFRNRLEMEPINSGSPSRGVYVLCLAESPCLGLIGVLMYVVRDHLYCIINILIPGSYLTWNK